MSKYRKTESSIYDIYKSFSDLALMTLGAFLFLFVMLTLVSQMSQQNEVPRLKKQVADLQAQLRAAQAKNDQITKNIDKIITTDPASASTTILQAAGVNNKDFELFVRGLKHIPGKNLHLVVDATGSMHGVSAFLIPILRLIVSRAGKVVTAITWYSDDRFETYTGKMPELFDQLVVGAPFSGSIENIGHAFRTAAANAPPPGAYLLIGDEPSDDTVAYSEIPAPVFALPFGLTDPDTERDFGVIAEKTGGMKLHLDLK